MSTIVRGFHGLDSNVVLLKGAPERVLDRCNKAITFNGDQTELSNASKKTMIKHM